jgi:hypothetical protein
MVFDPNQNVLVLIGNTDIDNPYMYLYRYANGPAPPPPEKRPAPPAGLRVSWGIAQEQSQ